MIRLSFQNSIKSKRESLLRLILKPAYQWRVAAQAAREAGKTQRDEPGVHREAPVHDQLQRVQNK